MNRSVRIAVLASSLLLAPAALRARPLSARSPVAFTVTVPDVFVPVPGSRDGVHVFASQPVGAHALDLVLRPLPSTIDHAPFTEREARELIANVAPGSTVRLDHVQTMDPVQDVPLIIAHSASGDALAIATLPSTPRAMQLTVSGGPDDEARVTQLARDVAASFRASTNWLSDAQRTRRSAAYALLVAGWIVLGLYGLAWAARLRARPSPAVQSGAMALAGLVFVSTAALLLSLPRGATAILPWMPGLLGLVLVANAVAGLVRARR